MDAAQGDHPASVQLGRTVASAIMIARWLATRLARIEESLRASRESIAALLEPITSHNTQCARSKDRKGQRHLAMALIRNGLAISREENPAR